jgi:hypothetical protein
MKQVINELKSIRDEVSRLDRRVTDAVWMLQSQRDWWEKNHQKSDITSDLAHWISNRLDIYPADGAVKERATFLFDDFRRYCEKREIPPMTLTLWGRQMAKIFSKRKTQGRIYYLGIRMRRQRNGTPDYQQN